MNNKFITAFVIILSLVFFLFFKNFYLQSKQINNSNISNLKILKYIPVDNELSFISNSDSIEINKFLKKNFQSKEIKNINEITMSMLSFLGLDPKENISNIYDGEFALTIFNKNQIEKDILLIFKIKPDKYINDLLNIKKDVNLLDEIIEIKRPDKLNYLSHILQTKDNYIISATSKDLIINSFNFIEDKELKKERELQLKRLDKEIKEKKLLLISKNNFIKSIIKNNLNIQDNALITLFDYKNKNIKLSSFSINNSNLLKNSSFQAILKEENITGNIISSNRPLTHLGYLNSIQTNDNEKNLFKEVAEKIKTNIFISNDNQKWVIGFINNLVNKELFNNFKIIKDMNQNNLNINNVNYKIFYKDNLKYENNKVSYSKEIPIFYYESNDLILISNDLTKLLNNIKEENMLISESSNLIVDEKMFISNFDDDNSYKHSPIFNYIKYFFTDKLSFSVDNYTSEIKQKIPEINPLIKLETNINIF